MLCQTLEDDHGWILIRVMIARGTRRRRALRRDQSSWDRVKAGVPRASQLEPDQCISGRDAHVAGFWDVGGVASATLVGFPRRKSLPGVIGTGGRLDTPPSSSRRRLYVAVCIIGMLAKNRPVQLALAVITLAVQAIYILIEMNALGGW